MYEKRYRALNLPSTTFTEWAEKHFAQHNCCPTCKGDTIARTTHHILWFVPGVQDTNEATCHECGWVGTVQDLLPVAERRPDE